MTREDAIKIFNTVLLFGKCDCPKEEIEECLKMAIKALEQEPTTKNNLGVDCISRQALLNATVKKSSIWNHITNSESDNLETIVSKLPSVTPQPCEDAISRQAVLDIAGLSEWFDSSDSYNEFAFAIEKLPLIPSPSHMLDIIRNCFGCKYSKDNHNQDIEECHLCMWENQYTPTTKNDLPHCQHTDEEIAKSFIEDVEAVKDQLPCGEQMDFPSTFDEFAKDYGFKDKDEVYTNGSELIPVFRVKQWLEHISTTKNDLRVDAVSRQEVLDLIADYDLSMGQVVKGIHALPSVTPQEPRKGHWLRRPHVYGVTYCSVCDFELKIDNTNYCPHCGAKMESEE